MRLQSSSFMNTFLFLTSLVAQVGSSVMMSSSHFPQVRVNSEPLNVASVKIAFQSNYVSTGSRYLMVTAVLGRLTWVMVGGTKSSAVWKRPVRIMKIMITRV